MADSDGIYFSPQPLPVNLAVKNLARKDFRLELDCKLYSDRIADKKIFDSPKIYDSKKIKITIDGNAEVQKLIEFHPPEPGFYRVVCTIRNENGKTIEKSMLFGYDPEKFKTKLTRADDFEDFWKKRKQELAAVKPAFKITKNEQSNDDLDVYLVEMRSYGNVRIRGWYTVPTKPGPHAAILSVPGYTSTMRPDLYRKNVATFALNPRGHGNSKDDVDPKGAEYMFIDFVPGHPEKYIYTGAYLDCIRAIDFLVSRPEIDQTRIGVEGGSQGGGLSFATAALDQRVAFSAPDIPWLGDWEGYLACEKWGWEYYPKLMERIPGLTFQGINQFLSYFDTMNLANRIKCPVLMSVGLQDSVCPPRNSFATYNEVRSEKDYCVYPFSGHGVWYQHNEIKNKWMAKILGLEKLQ